MQQSSVFLETKNKQEQTEANEEQTGTNKEQTEANKEQTEANKEQIKANRDRAITKMLALIITVIMEHNNNETIVSEFGQILIYGSYLKKYVANQPFSKMNLHFKNNVSRDRFMNLLEWFVIKPRISGPNNDTFNVMYHDVGLTIQTSCNPDLWKLVLRTNVIEDLDLSDESFDFDVDVLSSLGSHNSLDFMTINRFCDRDKIIMNCYKHRFIALDANGRPNVNHRCDCDMKNNDERPICFCNCISRQSHRGKRMLIRMAEMKSMDWNCLNESCDNPLCIFATQ